MRQDPRERVRGEFEEISLGDARLNRRMARIGSRMVAGPDSSFPNAMADEAELEAFYRLASNKRVDIQTLIAPHVAATHELAAELGTVLVVHDSTECHFSEHAGVGYIGVLPGFILHAALAVTADEMRAPLGVMGLLPIVRSQPQTKKNRKRRVRQARASNRWGALVQRTEDASKLGASLVHVMDREADIYHLMAGMSDAGQRFVIRGWRNRPTLVGSGYSRSSLLSEIETLDDMVERTVELSSRNNDKQPRYTRKFPTRPQRQAQLAVRAARVRLTRPDDDRHSKPFVDVSVVQVHEVNTPAGQTAVEWVLLSTEPVSTREEILRIVDYYRARWRIEEYFKALKTGCAFESRQLESLDALLAALGILAPIAWQLLALRTATQSAPEQQASTILRATQIAVLHSLGRVQEEPTLKDAFAAIAALGGHLKRNGPPGWITLGRGFAKLHDYELGWIAAQREM